MSRGVTRRIVSACVVVLGAALASPAHSNPRIEHWQSANGARCYFVAAPEIPMIDVRIVLAAGSARDADKPGLARLVNELLSEGAGENIFVVTGGRILTPPLSASILNGITRNTVMTLADDLGLTLVEQPIAREQLYGADEIFMTGTAAEVTPVRQVDHITIGAGGCGPITRQLQDAFFGLFKGKTRDRWGWLEPL